MRLGYFGLFCFVLFSFGGMGKGLDGDEIGDGGGRELGRCLFESKIGTSVLFYSRD